MNLSDNQLLFINLYSHIFLQHWTNLSFLKSEASLKFECILAHVFEGVPALTFIEILLEFHSIYENLNRVNSIMFISYQPIECNTFA